MSVPGLVDTSLQALSSSLCKDIIRVDKGPTLKALAYLSCNCRDLEMEGGPWACMPSKKFSTAWDACNGTLPSQTFPSVSLPQNLPHQAALISHLDRIWGQLHPCLAPHPTLPPPSCRPEPQAHLWTASGLSALKPPRLRQLTGQTPGSLPV